MKIKRIILLIILLLVVGCAKNEFSVDEFLDKADFNGYILSENNEEYKNYKYIKNVYYAFNRDTEYFIQLLILENDDYAQKFFDLNKNEIAKLKTSNSYVKSKNINNYNLYHLETDEDYELIIRSKNNIIYIDAPIGYINEIEEFLSDLNIEY